MMSPQNPDARSERLLLVEDDDFSTHLIDLYLKKMGFSNVSIAGDGRSALDLVKSEKFDLILLDLNIPRVSGLDVLKRLKRDDILAETSVLMISSMTNIEEIATCIDLGAEDYLPKPFNTQLLAVRIIACLERRQMRREIQALKAQIAGDQP